MSTTLYIFHGSIPSFKHILKDGTEAIFRPDRENSAKGIYYTDSLKIARELMDEISVGHVAIYVDPQKLTIDSDLVDPINALKAQLRREIQLELEAKNRAQAEGIDAGNSTPAPTKAASTQELGVLASGNASAKLLPTLGLKPPTTSSILPLPISSSDQE